MRHVYLLGALIIASATAVACGDANTSQLGASGGDWGPGAASSGTSGASGTADPGTSSGATSGGTSGGLPDAAPPPPLPPKDSGPPTPPPPPPPASACVPTNIQTILNQQCVGCHSTPPVNGSLSPLMNLADLTATAKEDASKNEAQLSSSKLKGVGSSIMPPGSTGSANASAAAAFDAWIASNYTLGCSASDGGTPPPPPPPPDVFGGQPPFTPGSASQGEHTAGDSRITRNCLGCHGGGDAPTWSAAGRLTDGAGNGVAGAQVRVAKTDGTAGTTVYTDKLGLFWFRPGQFTSGLHAGVRNATTKINMVSAVTNGGCNSCHATGGTTTPIHLP